MKYVVFYIEPDAGSIKIYLQSLSKHSCTDWTIHKEKAFQYTKRDAVKNAEKLSFKNRKCEIEPLLINKSDMSK